MLFAASSNDFVMLFVSIELITITFYVLVSFQRSKIASLEAGVKYLILGALSSSFMVFGIALIWGTTGTLNFTDLAAVASQFARQQNLFTRRAARARRSRFQDRRLPVSNLGAGRLSRRAYSDDRIPRRRFEGCRNRPAVARAIHRRAERAATLVETAHRHFRHYDSLRQPLRAATAQPQATVRLFEYLPTQVICCSVSPR